MCVFWQPKEEKIAFYYSGQKRILLRPVSKTSEKSNFLKGLVHVFCQKQSCLRCEFFQANQGRKDRFLIFWIGKNKFQTRKVKSKKRSKKIEFFKEVSPWFLSEKLSFLPCGFFRQTKAEKIVFLIFWIEANKFQTRKVKF